MEPTDFREGCPWLIRPESFEVLARKFNELRVQDVKELLERPADKDLKSKMSLFQSKTESKDYYDLKNGIAVISISGPLTKHMSFFGFLMGASTFGYIAKSFREALEDSDVEGIVLNIDSPGGTVSGTESLGDLIFESRGKKPIVTFANGMMASAAYWIGSGADAMIGESTADIGSIGVLMVHRDYSKADEMHGLKITYLAAGKYKALGNNAEPLSEFARETFQDELNYIYKIFTETVARNRDAEIEDVLSKMADGKMFIGRQAADVGLIDEVGNLQMAIELAKAGSDNSTYLTGKGVSNMPNDKLTIENIEQLAAAYPNLVLEIREEVKKGIDFEAIKKDAAKVEQDRVCGLIVAHFGEDEGAKFAVIVESGVTVDQFVAIKATAPEANETDEELKAKMQTLIAEAAPDNPGSDQMVDATATKDYMALVDEYVAANNCKKVVAMKAVMAAHPDKHKEYLKSVN